MNVPKPAMLTRQQIADFARHGYILVRTLYTAAEMRDITAWTDEVSNYPEVPGKYMMYFEQSQIDPGRRLLCRMEDFEPYHQNFSRLFNSERMLGYVTQLFGRSPLLF